jgi:hypothetical protein
MDRWNAWQMKCPGPIFEIIREQMPPKPGWVITKLLTEILRSNLRNGTSTTKRCKKNK